MRIVPAVLANTPQDFISILRSAETFTDYVQIDIMDGEFVPSISVSVDRLAGIATSLQTEAHLMVVDPLSYLPVLNNIGTEQVVFHYEAVDEPDRIIETIVKEGFKVGLAINPETDNERIIEFVDKVDSVLYLAVHPGFYGAAFIPEVLDKIRDLRRKKPSAYIGIDGGIKLDNVKEVAQTGLDFICIGSAIFNQDDPKDAFRRFQKLVSE